MSETRNNEKIKLTDDCPTKGNIPTKVYITSYRQMIKFQNLGNLLEPLLELMDLQKIYKHKYNVHSKERKKKKEKVTFLK